MGLLDFGGLPPDIKVMCAELPQLMEHLRVVVLVVVPCVLSLWLYRRTNSRLNAKLPPSKPPFEYPAIEPWTEELSQIKPTPYRPFRWGAYQ